MLVSGSWTMKATTLGLVVTAFVLAGCATLSKEECRMVDWRTVGYEDGVAGRTGDRIGQHRKACADHGVRPDLDAYQAGRAEGLREYCQARNGYRVGLSGAGYGGPCPADLAPGFMAAYDAGRQLYVRRYRVEHADERLTEMRLELAGLQHRIAGLGFSVASTGSGAESRTQDAIHAAHLIERHERLRADIEQLEKDREQYQRELDDYEAEVAFVP
jgi:hypothetical protein